MTQSNIESAYWNGGGAATLTNRNDNALGFFNGTTIVSNGVNWHRAIRDVALTENVSYVLTCFYKQGTSGRLRFELRTNNNSSSIIGIIGSLNVTSTAGGALELLSDEAYGDVRKLSAKWTPNYTGTARLGLGPDSFTSGETVIGYGVQVEEGAFPTSYIPTSGSAVTRAIDFCSMPISRFFYNTSEGSLFVVFDIATSEANKGICAINNSASPTDNRVDLRSQGTAFITSDNVDFDGLNVSSFNQYTTNKAAFAFKSGDSALVKNGGTVDTLSSVFTLPSFDILRVGSIDAGTPNLGSGHIKSIQYFPRRLSDTKLQELTV